MNFNIDQLKKKIIYRSNYRGTKEMDKLLGAFTKKYINQLNQDELIDLEKLLDIDDSSLYNFFNGIDNEIKTDQTNVLKLFKNFKYSSEDK
jgi:antitoxin CptB